MAANLLLVALNCPRCGRTEEVEVETTIDEQGHGRGYHLGELVAWLPGRRPPHGGKTVDGYVVCPACGKDFFVVVTVEADRVGTAAVDTSRPGYIQ